MEFQPSTRARRFQFTMRMMFIGMTIVALFSDSWSGACVTFNNLRQTQECADRFKLAALGILYYEEEHSSSFPPAYTVDTQRRRMESWRVSILPYLQYTRLYYEYHHNEPWDGPNNRKLHGERTPNGEWTPPSYYRCPVDLSEPKTSTNLLAVVGPGTAWPGTTPGCTKNCVKGASHTALLVEVAHSGIHWMEPRDLELSNFDPTIDSRSGRGLSSNHAGGANVVMADGSVRCLSPNTAPRS